MKNAVQPSFLYVREIDLKEYADMILIQRQPWSFVWVCLWMMMMMTQIAWPALGIELRIIHKQLFKNAAYCVQPQSYLELVGVRSVLSGNGYGQGQS